MPAGAAKSDVADREPLVYVEHAHLGISWRELLHLRLMASLRLVEPKITVTQKKSAGSPRRRRRHLRDARGRTTARDIAGGSAPTRRRRGH